MSVVDPIADMLTRVRNAHHALHKDVSIPASKIKESIGQILKDEGYVAECANKEGLIKITLKYAKGKPLIAGLRRISTPGRRVYVGSEDIPMVQNGLGICILSTSQGILTGGAAKERGIGGELLCEVW